MDKCWPAGEAAGLARVRHNGCHACRHMFASVLLANGVFLPEVAAYLGHSDISITARTYSHDPASGDVEGITWRGLASRDDLLSGVSLESG